MTYEEIKARLTQCEVKLQEFQQANNLIKKSKTYTTTVKKLTLIKETFQKMLEQEEKGMIRTNDPAQAEKLAKKGVNVDLKTEQDGIAFSKEETMSISKEVGKALAMALRSAGDEVESMKVRNIEPNSFEIYVVYKNEVEDTFSFYISEDTLHLVDFSFDKELTNVGVKPSGEPVVNVDVLSNELTKHFKSQMSETMTDQEFAAAGEADRLEKHPEKDKIKKIQALIAAQQKDESIDEEAPEGMYYFEVSQDDSTRALFIMDLLFRPEFEKTGKKGFNLSRNVYTFEDGKAAAAAMKLLQDRGGVEIIDTNIDLDKNKELGLSEAPEGMYYLEVSVRDAKKAMDIMDDLHRRHFVMNGSNVYYFKDGSIAYDAMMDLGAQNIEIVDTNIGDGMNYDDNDNFSDSEIDAYYDDIKEEEQDGGDVEEGWDMDEASDYAKRRAAERDYQPSKRDVPPKKYKEPKNDYFARRKSELDYKYGSAGQEMYQEGDLDAQVDGGDLDIGHQDDEPDMLKQNVYDIATYAAKLYKQLDKYDRYDGEVDFPHWWQKKVILARDYISAAQHYLEFEEKQPALDALALEEGVDEASHAKLKKEYDELVGKMKQLAQHFKTAEGEKKEKIVAALKQHTARKRELEQQIDSAVGGIGVGQELDSNVAEDYSAFKNYDDIVGGIHVRFGALEDYVQDKEPEAMDDLQSAITAFEMFDEKMSYRVHEELEENADNDVWFTPNQKHARQSILNWIDKHPNTKGRKPEDLDHAFEEIINGWLETYEYKDGYKKGLNDRDSKQAFWKAIVQHSQGKLDEAEAKPIPGSILRGYNMNVKNPQTMAQALLSLFNQINDKESMDFKKHSGIKRVLAMLDKIAKTQDTETPAEPVNEEKATCCGKCGRVHVKGTKCKTPYLKGKDHCRYN